MTNVLLVDDHVVFTDALRPALEAAGLSVAGIAHDGLEAIQMFTSLRPKVVLLDINLPGMNGHDVCREIRSIDPRAIILFLSGRTTENEIVGGLRAGAVGFISKTDGVEELVGAIERAAKREPYVSQGLIAPILFNYISATPGEVDPLTVRERQVLQLIAEGQSSKQIAANLHLSVKTVETHRTRLMDKLGMHNVAALVRYAIRQGLVSA